MEIIKTKIKIRIKMDQNNKSKVRIRVKRLQNNNKNKYCRIPMEINYIKMMKIQIYIKARFWLNKPIVMI
jgi:hypothetical protein